MMRVKMPSNGASSAHYGRLELNNVRDCCWAVIVREICSSDIDHCRLSRSTRFAPPDDFRRVRFCPEKSGPTGLRIGLRLISKRSPASEKYWGGAGFRKRKGRDTRFYV